MIAKQILSGSYTQASAQELSKKLGIEFKVLESAILEILSEGKEEFKIEYRMIPVILSFNDELAAFYYSELSFEEMLEINIFLRKEQKIQAITFLRDLYTCKKNQTLALSKFKDFIDSLFSLGS